MAVNDPVAGKKASFCCGVDLWWGLGVKKPPQARSSSLFVDPTDSVVIWGGGFITAGPSHVHRWTTVTLAIPSELVGGKSF